MKLRKFLKVLLTTTMILSLTACGNAQDSVNMNLVDDVGTEIEETEAVDIDVEENSNSGNDNVQAYNIQNEDNQTQDDKGEYIQVGDFQTTADIEETVLVDENDIKITATELSCSKNYAELKLLIENNSDEDYSFISGSMGYSCNSVNGYMIEDGYLNADVAAGKKSNESIKFNIEGLKIYGITEIADIQIGFKIQDSDYDSFYTGPRQIKTSSADLYDYNTDTFKKSINSGIWESVYDCTIDYYAENELHDQNDVRIISEAFMTNKDGEKIILLEIQNDSQELIYGVTSNILVNGVVFYSSDWFGDTINPNTKRIMDLSLSSMLDRSYWDILGFSEVVDFAFSFELQDTDYEEIKAAEEISISLSDEKATIDDSGTEVYNEDGIRIISKGLIEDSSDYSDDIHMLLLVENNYTETISIDDSYGSLSVNGFMTDCIASSRKVPAGKYTVIDVEMQSSSLEDNNISGIEDITEAEITLEIKGNNYKKVAEPTIAVSY